ncbi:hypothetical protein ACIBG0_00310 [Nocardia sp. NPDC050630]|uniref:hypothetical protein n=1 Tax=Nocardia sp. NPDC050630 TaxID=3364321 RepID=UPI0037AE8F31
MQVHSQGRFAPALVDVFGTLRNRAAKYRDAILVRKRDDKAFAAAADPYLWSLIIAGMYVTNQTSRYTSGLHYFGQAADILDEIARRFPVNWAPQTAAREIRLLHDELSALHSDLPAGLRGRQMSEAVAERLIYRADADEALQETLRLLRREADTTQP